jgi:phage tail sheath gpL-like
MANQSIVLVGLNSAFPNPGTYIEIDFAQGPVSGSSTVRTCLVMGNKTSAGSATVETQIYGPDTQTPCATENDVITLFGTGSQLHRAFLAFTKVNTTTALYFIAVAESAGAQASLTITIANAATSNGNFRFWCGAEFIDTTITSGDAATAIATNVSNSINSQTRWAVTAAPSGATVVVTAKNHGPEGNWIRVQSLITPGAGTIATTTSLTANTYLSGGVTADSVTNALATIKPYRYYYTVVCDSDSANVGAVVTQVTSVAQPTTGIRQRVVSGFVDTLANGITQATGINNPRSEIEWGPALDYTPIELAANQAALFALLEAGAAVGVNRKNFSLFPTPQGNDTSLWFLKSGRGGAAVSPTQAQITSALSNGLSPFVNTTAGPAQYIKRCTTRSLNGSTSDYRIRDAHKVTICDYWGDDAVAITQLNFGGKDLLADVQAGQPPPPPIATTPSLWGNELKALVTRYDQAGQWASTVPGVRGGDTINANAIVQQETSPPTRLSALFGLTPVNIADQFAILAQQVA